MSNKRTEQRVVLSPRWSHWIQTSSRSFPSATLKTLQTRPVGRSVTVLFYSQEEEEEAPSEDESLKDHHPAAEPECSSAYGHKLMAGHSPSGFSESRICGSIDYSKSSRSSKATPDHHITTAMFHRGQDVLLKCRDAHLLKKCPLSSRWSTECFH